MSDNVIKLPTAVDCEHVEYPFPGGAKVTFDAGDMPLTVAQVVYMLRQIEHNILTGMMD